MADPTKPSDAPSSASPISPQIKIPPAGPQPTPSLGGSIPPNLPIKEEIGPSPTPLPTLPPKPPMQGPQPSPDIKLKPPSAPPAPPPAQTPPRVEIPGAPVFKSSIRTMQEDIAAVKKGQTPTGFQVEKQSEKDIMPPPVSAPGPKITMPPRPAQEVRLGGLEKSRSLPSTKLPSFPPMPTIPPAGPVPKPAGISAGLSVPTGGGVNQKRLILMAGGLIVIAFLIWFFALRVPMEPEATPTPTPTSTATPTPLTILRIFGSVGTIKVLDSGDPLTALKIAVASQSIELGEAKVFSIVDDSDNAYDFNKFLSRLLISIPNIPESIALKTNEWALGIYGQQKGSSTTEVDKKLFILMDTGTTINADQVQTLMDTWGPSIITAFAPLFGYDKNTKNQLAPDVYNTVDFSYVKIPDKTLGLAHTIVGKYLLFASSKDSFRAAVDAIVGSMSTGF